MKTKLLLAAVLAAAMALSFRSDSFFQELSTRLARYWSSAVPKLYLQTDRPWYKPGEEIWFKAWVREAKWLSKLSGDDQFLVELLNPQGIILKQQHFFAKNGSGTDVFVLPARSVGGIYILRARLLKQKEAFFSREITVQQAVLPRLRMALEFERKAYGPGDTATARLDLHNLENQFLARHPFEFSLFIEGEKVLSGQAKTDEGGRAYLRFPLPDSLGKADGLLSVRIPFRGSTELISRAVPILLNRIDLQFLPEGGDMIAGMPGKVAFKALDEFGRPADVSGIVLDKAGKEVARFRSFHDGMGSFFLTPQAGGKYSARLQQSAGNQQEFTLPDVLPAGYQLTVSAHRKKFLMLKAAASSHSGAVYISGMAGGEIRYRKKFELAAKPRLLRVPVGDWPSGIATFTLFDGEGEAQAERIVFLHPDRRLRVEIKTDKEKYLPREKVELSLAVSDYRGRPVSGDFSLSVIDDNLVRFADDKQGGIAAHLLLQSELRGKIENPGFYFDPEEPKAAEALDFLMLTQGWRRTGWHRPTTSPKKPEEHYPSGERLLVKREESRIKEIKKDIATPAVPADLSADIEPARTAEAPPPPPPPPPPPEPEVQEVFRVVEEMPRFPGCEDLPTLQEKQECAGQQLLNYLYRNIQYPAIARENCIAGIVIVQFTIDRNGFIREPKLVRDIGGQCGEAAIRVVEDMMESGMQWSPGKQRGRPVEVQFNLPVRFTLDSEQVAYVRPKIRPVLSNTQAQSRQFYSPVYTADAISDGSDQRSTLFWASDVHTDKKGRAQLVFYTSDAFTTFQIRLEGLSEDGQIAQAEHRFHTQSLLEVDTRIPAQLLSGDTLKLPVRLLNHDRQARCGSLSIDIPRGLNCLSVVPDTLCLPAYGYRNITIALLAGQAVEAATINLVFSDGRQSARWQGKLDLRSRGFPIEKTFAGLDRLNRYELSIPDHFSGSLEASLNIYTNPLEEILGGMERMLRQPGGCFEQVSSTNYPNLLVLDLLQQTGQSHEELKNRARRLLEDGYQRLVKYEAPGGGFHWWGNAPGHEALTAYGIMEFVDMKRIFPVDQQMIDRASAWLLQRRDGRGSWLLSSDHAHSWKGGPGVRDAYIVWALCEAGMGNQLWPELEKVYKEAMESRDSYCLALLANALQAAGDPRTDEVQAVLLNEFQPGGYWMGKSSSIVGSINRELRIETTALAALSLIRARNLGKELQGAMRFLALSRDSYGFGHTQSTVLALKAMAAYAGIQKEILHRGEVVVSVEGREILRRVYHSQEKKLTIRLDSFLHIGKQEVVVQFGQQDQPLPHEMQVRYTVRTPPSSLKCPLQLQTIFAGDRSSSGATVRLNAILENKTERVQPTPIALIGIPAGLSLQPWQLKALTEQRVIDYYEQQPGFLVVYFEKLKAREVKHLSLDLRADIPGYYEAPASSAYLYYQNGHRSWSAPGRILVE